jgi:hypothetical protein
MAKALEVGGTCDPRFADVKRAFGPAAALYGTL